MRLINSGRSTLLYQLQNDANLHRELRSYNGGNNGQIGLSIRRASERFNIARGTAQRALTELQERGFIELVTKGAFSRKPPYSSEWRLTFNTCDETGELASKAFMRWGRENHRLHPSGAIAIIRQPDGHVSDLAGSPDCKIVDRHKGISGTY